MRPIKKGSTDQLVYVRIADSSSSTGAGLTGLAYNSSGLVCSYVRPLGSATALTLATQTVTGAHSDGGFVEVSAANLPGLYRLDLSDAMVATGVDRVVVMLSGASNMVPCTLEIPLTDQEPWGSVVVASGGIGSGAHAAAELNAIADGVLDRNMATGTDSGTDSTSVRTPRQALRALRNKVVESGGTLTVKKEDDSTTSWTAAVTRTAATDTLTGVDPT